MAAQMAYQQTMMAMSAAGSQMGDHPSGTQDGRASPGASSIRAASPFGYGGYGMMPGATMSMYGFPQYSMGMPGMPGMGNPGQMGSPAGGMPGMQPGMGMPGWQSPPGGNGMRTSVMEQSVSHNGSDRPEERQAS